MIFDEVKNTASLYCENNYDFLKILGEKNFKYGLKEQFFKYAHSRCLAGS